MTWLFIAYLAVGYYYFWNIFKYYEKWDKAGTVIMNSALALTIGPLLLIPVILFNWIQKAWDYINEH